MGFNVAIGQTPSLRITLNEKMLTKIQANLYELAQQDGFTGSLTEFLASLKGENGVTFIPKMENGILSWQNNGGLENPPDLLLADPELPNLIEHILNHG